MERFQLPPDFQKQTNPVRAKTWLSPIIGSLLAGLLAVYYWIWRQSRFVRLINAIPGPDGLPFLGNVLDLNVPNDEVLNIVSGDWVKKYGNIYRIWFTIRPVILITSPELLDTIMGNHKFIKKPIEYDIFTPFIGKGIPVAIDERWKKNRRLLNPAFHFQILNTFVDAINSKSIICVEEFEEAIENNKGDEIDVFPIMSRSTLDIICDTFMGREALKKEEKALFLNNLEGFERVFQQRIVKPWLRINWFFKLTAPGRENARCVEGLHQFCNMIIKARREALERDAAQIKWNSTTKSCKMTQTNDAAPEGDVGAIDVGEAKKKLPFLDLVLTELGKEHFNETDIRDEVNAFLGASQTTALAFTWFLCMIAKNPKHQQLLHDEVDHVFGESDRPCTSQDLTELKYLECCIKETMRLYPSIPFVLRCLPEDVEIGGYVLPKGVTVAIMIHSLHHNPQVYPNPEVFNPERFLPENSVGRHPYAFIPFSAGPRNCIGLKFAMLELKIVLANLLRRFDFSVRDPSVPIKASLELLLTPKDGVHLIVTKRQQDVR
ncbi:cytochrome P450 4c3-like isoform X2 [Daphnia carinata]|nr:cytochrome P450 4c3-like isoform X2 [Daphnia carinata]